MLRPGRQRRADTRTRAPGPQARNPARRKAALRWAFHRRTDRLIWRGPNVNHAFVTIIADVAVKDIAALRASIEKLGNPAIPHVAAVLDGLGVIHFSSLNVFEASAGDRGYLVFEFS